jgi:hypothetical protein
MKILTVGAELFYASRQTPMKKQLKLQFKKIVSLHPCSLYVESNTNIRKKEMCWFNKYLYLFLDKTFRYIQFLPSVVK